MILPTKGIAPRKALISLGGEILELLDETKTVSRLWDDFRKRGEYHEDVTFDWFVLSLDLIFMLGAVELEHSRLRRSDQRT
jgi:hypothetical protein